MTRQCHVHIYGTAGKNLGDNAIAYASIQYLKRYARNVRFGLAWQGQEKTWDEHGVDRISLNRRTAHGHLRLASSVKSADVVVIGGGSVIQDSQGLSLVRGMLAYMVQVVALAKLFGKPVYTLPIGVDRLISSLGKDYARFVLRRADRVYVRDRTSLELARAYAQELSPRFVVSADPAYLIDDIVATSGHDSKKARVEPYAVVSLVRENLVDSRFMPAVKAFIEYWLHSDARRRIVLLAMDSRPHEELSLYRRLQRDLGFPTRVTISVPQDPCAAFGLIKDAELMVAMRLHAMILGLGYTPMLALSRTTKTHSFVEDNGVEGYRLDDDIPPVELVQRTLRCAADHAALRAQRVRREQHKSVARETLRELATVVSGGVSKNNLIK